MLAQPGAHGAAPRGTGEAEEPGLMLVLRGFLRRLLKARHQLHNSSVFLKGGGPEKKS